MTTFIKLNEGWNAEPNAPNPFVVVDGKDLLLRFGLNSFVFSKFREEDLGEIRFSDCWRYRLGPTNDEGWFRGQCRFSKLAPKWGEFYEVSGDLRVDEINGVWTLLSQESSSSRHFLFYLRDHTFECDAKKWSFTVLRGQNKA